MFLRPLVMQAEAEIAYSQERWTEALSSFEIAVDLLDSMDRRLDHARSLKRWGAAHLSLGEPEHIDRGKMLLEEARTEFKYMGSPGYVEAIDAQLENRA